MDSRKKKIITVLCVASAILVWRVYAVVTKYAPSTAQATPAEVAGNPDAPVLPNPVPQPPKPEPRLHDIAKDVRDAQQAIAEKPWGRDPFADVEGFVRDAGASAAPAQVTGSIQAPPPPAIQFTGVSKSGDKWLAAVHGSIVGVGDVIDEKYTVTEITKRSITLTAQGWSYRYELGSPEAVVRPMSEAP